ncbi:MAG: hypothetical protein KAW61_10620, partial [candidate division Zixibacteria bacterium]|nr:hypothetical protein [candidate division Zixibacteria bacterium]
KRRRPLIGRVDFNIGRWLNILLISVNQNDLFDLMTVATTSRNGNSRNRKLTAIQASGNGDAERLSHPIRRRHAAGHSGLTVPVDLQGGGCQG